MRERGEKNTVAVVRSNPHCEKEMVGAVQQKSMILFLLRCALDVFATEKHVNHGGEYGMEIPLIFLFYGPEKIIKLAKDEITKIEENVKETVKQCLK